MSGLVAGSCRHAIGVAVAASMPRSTSYPKPRSPSRPLREPTSNPLERRVLRSSSPASIAARERGAHHLRVESAHERACDARIGVEWRLLTLDGGQRARPVLLHAAGERSCGSFVLSRCSICTVYVTHAPCRSCVYRESVRSSEQCVPRSGVRVARCPQYVLARPLHSAL